MSKTYLGGGVSLGTVLTIPSPIAVTLVVMLLLIFEMDNEG